MACAVNRALKTASDTFERTKARAEEALGGPARLHVMLLLGSVLGLDAADKAAVSAVTPGSCVECRKQLVLAGFSA